MQEKKENTTGYPIKQSIQSNVDNAKFRMINQRINPIKDEGIPIIKKAK